MMMIQSFLSNRYFFETIKTRVIKLGIAFIFLWTNQANSQYFPESFYSKPEIDSANCNALIFNIENSNFLKNDEYFNDIVRGYTLIGYHLTPKLVYFPTKNTSVELGVHLLKYSGIEQFSKVLPHFSFHYQPVKSVEVIFGSIKGTTNHKMAEPIFDFEKYFTESQENGLQFLFNTRHYDGDIWINWQQFIFKGDTTQEIFTMGLSNRFYLNQKNSKHHFSIPLQSIFVHHGGQINEASAPVVSQNNSAIGLAYHFEASGKWLKTIGIEALYLMYNDMNSDTGLPFNNGYGAYIQGFAHIWDLNISLAYWNGHNYHSLRGNPLFQSVSTANPLHVEPDRSIILNRFIYEKKLISGLAIGAGFEGDYDIKNHFFDYWYMVYINFNSDFLIKKVLKKQ